jgi:hypothetical protein
MQDRQPEGDIATAPACYNMECNEWVGISRKVVESMSIETYIIAVKRGVRGSEPVDWKEQIGHTSGIQILSTNSSRLQVCASDEIINRIRLQWGHLFHIEKQIVHKPQSTLDV